MAAPAVADEAADSLQEVQMPAGVKIVEGLAPVAGADAPSLEPEAGAPFSAAAAAKAAPAANTCLGSTAAYGSKGCFQHNGDIVWAGDTQKDGMSAAVGVFVFFGLSTNPADIPPVLLPAALLAVVTVLTKIFTGWYAARRAGIGSRGRWRAGGTLVARGEFSIVIAGLAVATEPRIGPLATAYVLILVIVGPLTARWTQPIAEKIQALRDGDKPDQGGAAVQEVLKSAPERRLGDHDDLTPEPAGEARGD
ncbi:hypothetical protein SMICM17S_06826 [Streptomyces microflavus]